MKVNLYSPKLKKASHFELPKDLSEKVSEDLLAQAMHVYRARLHPGNSKVKTRAEISLTKAKWYRQKGTGRARHGAKSAPIFVGGGVAHGPKGVKTVLALPAKMKKKALAGALHLALSEKRVSAAKDLSMAKKTSEMETLIRAIREGEGFLRGKITIVVSPKNSGILMYTRNIPDVFVETFSDLNAYKVMLAGRMVFDTDIFSEKKKGAKA